MMWKQVLKTPVSLRNYFSFSSDVKEETDFGIIFPEKLIVKSGFTFAITLYYSIKCSVGLL